MQGRIAIIGCGNMALSLLRGLLKSSWFKREYIVATTRTGDSAGKIAKELNVEAHNDNKVAVSSADIVILGVKPQMQSKVMQEIKPCVKPGTLVISIAAGIATETIEAALPQASVIRAMPNTPVAVDAGATALCRGRSTRREHMQTARAIFESVGLVVEVEEYQMDAVTALSGSGPMYIFQVIEGLTDAGVKVGLPREVALALTIQTVLGAAKLAQISGEHPAKLKDRVTSPGGTTITALHVLDKGGLRGILFDAVEAAAKRSQELGRKAAGAQCNTKRE